MQRTLDGLGEILRRRQPGETQATAWKEVVEPIPFGLKKTSPKVKLLSTYWLPLDLKTMKHEGSKPQIYGL